MGKVGGEIIEKETNRNAIGMMKGSSGSSIRQADQKWPVASIKLGRNL